MAFSDMTPFSRLIVGCMVHMISFFVRFISHTMLKAVLLKLQLFRIRSFWLIWIRVNSESEEPINPYPQRIHRFFDAPRFD